MAIAEVSRDRSREEVAASMALTDGALVEVATAVELGDGSCIPRSRQWWRPEEIMAAWGSGGGGNCTIEGSKTAQQQR